MATREQYLAALKRAAAAGDTQAANDIADYMSANLPSAAEIRQQDFDSMPAYQQALIGAGQSVAELGTGIKDLFGGDVSQARADEAMVDSVDSGWKTAGRVGGELAQVIVPGGAIGKVASKGLPLALKASKAGKFGTALAGDVLATGATEELRGRDGLTAAGTTAGVGLALPGFLKAGAKIAAPMREGAQQMLDSGIRLTPGQARGGIAGAAEEAMTYIPGVAGGVRKLREKAMEDWNRSIRAGDAAPNGWGTPQEYQQMAKDAFDDSYEWLFQGDMKMASDLTAKWGVIGRDSSKALPPNEAGQINRLLANNLVPLRADTVDGRTVHQIYRTLGKLASQSAKKGDGIQTAAYNAARDSLEESMPKGVATHLKGLNKDYAKFAVLRDATGKAGPAKRKPPGMITPGDLMASSIKGRKTSASLGKAPLQKEAEQAVEILGANMPLASGVQGAAANLGIPAAAAFGLMNPVGAAGAMTARGALVNQPMRRALTDPASSMLVQGAERIARTGSGMGASRMSEAEREKERQREMARALRGQR